MNKYIYKYFLISFFACILLSIPIIRSYRQLNQETKNNNNNKKTVILHPIIGNDNQYLYNRIPNFPFVKTKIGNLHYFFALIAEEINQQKKTEQDLVYTYAGKRLSELEIWGNDLKVLGTIKNLTRLENWWIKQDPGIWKIYKYNIYKSWEASLARYYILWKKEISNLYTKENENQLENLTILKGYLIKHKQKFASIVYNSNKSPDEKKYLFNLYSLIYNELNKRIGKSLPEYDSRTIYYTLNDLVRDKQETYDIFLSLWDIPSYINLNPRLMLNDRLIFPQVLKENTAKFKNIIIDNQQKLLKLRIDNSSFPIKIEVASRLFDEKNKLYQISMNIPKLPDDFNYYIKVNFKFNQRVILNINKEIIIKNKIYLQEIFRRDLFPINTASVLFEPVFFDNNYNYSFSFLSYQPLTESELKSLKIEFQPVIDPDIIIEKHFGTINTGNINTVDSFPYHKAIFTLFLLITFAILFYIFKKAIKKSALKRLIEINGYFSYLLKNIVENRLALIALFIITFTANLFFNKNNSFFLTILAMILWIFCVISYSLEAKITIIFSAIFLGFCLLSSVFNINLFMEKTAIWFYMFLVLGVGQYILETIIHTKVVLNNFRTFDKSSPKFNKDLVLFVTNTMTIARKQQITLNSWLKTIHADILSLSVVSSKQWRRVKMKILDPIFNNFIKKLVFFYIPHSKNKADVSRSVRRVTITLIVIVAYLVIHYIDYQYATYINLSSSIIKVQPKIVYHSTKVILRGYNFSWQLNANDKLMSQYGKVSTTLWNDSKIIFTVPLHWKPGNIRLWIERERVWNSSKIIVKSKTITIKLLSVSNNMSKDDDEYFKQLKLLDKETLELNGY